MEFSSILDKSSLAVYCMVIGSLLGVVACFLMFLSLRLKIHARDELVSILSHDEEFLRKIAKMEIECKSRNIDMTMDSDSLEKLQKLIVEHVSKFNFEKQKLLEAPLRQQSYTGRIRYIRNLAKDVDLRIHQTA